MIRYTAPFFLGVVVGCATFLFSTSQKVQQAGDRLAALNVELAQERQSARVLRAEWDYLNRPDRLEALARQYLDLEPPESGALMASLDDLKALPAEDPPAPAEKIGARPGAHVAAAADDIPLIPPPVAARARPASPVPFLPSAVAAAPAPVFVPAISPASARTQAAKPWPVKAGKTEKIAERAGEKPAVFSASAPVPPPTPVQRVRRSFEEVLARIEPMGGPR